MTVSKPMDARSRNRHSLLSLFGVLVGAAIGATIVAFMRDGEVDLGRHLALYAGIVVGGGIAAIIVQRLRG